MDRGLLDIGLLLEPVDIGKYEFIRLDIKERWVVLMRPDDPLASQENVTAQDLLGRPLILPRRTSVRGELAKLVRGLLRAAERRVHQQPQHQRRAHGGQRPRLFRRHRGRRAALGPEQGDLPAPQPRAHGHQRARLEARPALQPRIGPIHEHIKCFLGMDRGDKLSI